jgi:MFS family permease
VRRLLRPFGYLLILLVWTALFVIVVVITLFSLPLALQANDGAAGFQASPLFHGSDSWMAYFVVPLFLMPIFGSISYVLVLASLGMMLASATLFGRSLRPSYAHERLSATLFGSRTGLIGSGLTSPGLSLLPLRLTRWSKLVMIVQFNGWVVNAGTFVIGPIWGALYLFTVGWAEWPVSGTAMAVCVGITTVLSALLVVAVWRRRHDFPRVMPDAFNNTVYEWSWPNQPPESGKRSSKRRPGRDGHPR